MAICSITVAMWLGLAATPASATGATSIQVENAWIRWLPANLPAAGYATIKNLGDVAQILTGASSATFGEVSLHQNRNQGGNVEMREVQRITIGPHSTLNLAAAGFHMMLMQPNRPLKPGDRVPITLRFAGGATLTVEFDVREPASAIQ
jgi:periplasmic copper chaperone A